jgi:hypothetical protein
VSRFIFHTFRAETDENFVLHVLLSLPLHFSYTIVIIFIILLLLLLHEPRLLISDITCYDLHDRDLFSPPRPDRPQGRQGVLSTRLQGVHGPEYIHIQLRFRRFTPRTISVMEVVFGLRHRYQSFGGGGTAQSLL